MQIVEELTIQFCRYSHDILVIICTNFHNSILETIAIIDCLLDRDNWAHILNHNLEFITLCGVVQIKA